MTNTKRAVTSLIIMCVVIGIGANTAHAIIPVGGWGYSVGYAIDRVLGWLTPEDDMWYWYLDPAGESIKSGRVTLHYDSSLFTVVETGWVGDFAADPSIPAPPVTVDGAIPTLAPGGDPWVLQGANAGMAGHSVVVDEAAGTIAIEFDWGPAGYQPATDDHFNFFGIGVTGPALLTGFEFAGPGAGDFGLMGSAADVAANGTAAQTYMVSTTGAYLGEAPFGDLVGVYRKAGDADGDGDVDLDDFVILKNEFGLTPPPRQQADFDGDGDVDLDDFLGMKINFGTGSVPEPTSLSLLALAALAIRRRRR